MAPSTASKITLAWMLTWIVLAVALPSRLTAQTAPPAEAGIAEAAPPKANAAKIVARVEISGLSPEDVPDALAIIATRSGSVYSENVAKTDQKRLMDTGLYENATVITSQSDAGVVVNFILARRMVVEAVEFQGNDHYDDDDLADEIAVTAGASLDRSQAVAGVRSIESLYRKAGYYFVSVGFDQTVLTGQHRLIYHIIEGPRVRLRSVDFEYVTGEGEYFDIKLSTQIETGDGFWIILPGRLDNDKLDDDVAKLRNFFRINGFLDAEVTYRLSFTPDRELADLVFVIDEGPRYRVARIAFNGNKLYADNELLNRLVMTRGKHYGQVELGNDVDAIREAYGRLGYINASVNARTIYLDPAAPAPEGLTEGDNAFVAVEYDIVEGSRYRLGRVEIRGNEVTKDRVVRRNVQMNPGDYFDSVAMKRSEENLRNVGLFDEASVVPLGNLPDSRDALVTVKEANTAMVSIGAGFSSDTGLGGSLRYRQRNFSMTRLPDSFVDAFAGKGFRGDGQTFEFSLEPGVDTSRMSVSWNEPKLLDGPLNLFGRAYALTWERDDYTEDSMGLRGSLGRLLSGLWYGEVNTGVEQFDISGFDDDTPSEFRDEAGKHLIYSVGAALVRNDTNNRWQPSAGGKLTLAATQALVDYTFTKTSAEYVHYFTTHEDALDRKYILALKGRTEYIFGDAPNSRKLYGGGLSHVRGFRSRGISPRSADVITTQVQSDVDENGDGTIDADDKKTKIIGWRDDPIGGDFLAYLGAEYSIPLYADILRGVVFLDSGTVEDDYRVTTWRVSTGFGFRMNVGNIPVVLNFGFPLVEDEQDDDQLLSFTLGWIF